MFDAKKIKADLIEWIRAFFEENGKNSTAVVGISGGKDSSVTAALCAEALGRERVIGVLMPQGVQHDADVAVDVVEHIGIKRYIVNIGAAVETILDALKDGGADCNNRAVRVNTPARVRMTVLYAVAAAVDGRVANTCNMSEDFVGYSTKFGDSAGDFAPLANLTVTEVRAIGRELGLPAKFTDKVPEDGLSGLTDEQNLGFSYAELDKYIREGICADPSLKEKIDRMHRLSLHKITPMPAFSPGLS